MTEGTPEYVTTESLAGLHLWQNFHDLLVSNECISYANSNLDPLELSISLFRTDCNRSEMQKVRDIMRSPESSFMSKMEVMKSLLARNSILQNWMLCLNLKRHANKEQATQHLILTIMEPASTASCLSVVNLSKMGKITIHGQRSCAYFSFRNHLWEKIQGVQVELRDTESKVYQVERFGLLLSPDITIAVLTDKEDDSSSYQSIPKNCLENISPQELRYGMSCLDPNQNDTTWVSKTVGRLAILDYCINSENMKSELALFPVERNQYVLAVVKMNQEMNFRRQLIVHFSQGCIDVVENIASNHRRFCDLRSSFLDVSILNEVLSTNKNIPNLANFNF